VSNGPYGMTDIAGLGHRARLDAGTLGVVAVTVNNALQATTLLVGARGRGLTTLTAGEVVVDADVPQIPVGIDGETIMMATPVRCAIRPRALRVRVPRDRPGIRPPNPNSTGQRSGNWPHSAPQRHTSDAPHGSQLPHPEALLCIRWPQASPLVVVIEAVLP
jgi:hypothetical protein